MPSTDSYLKRYAGLVNTRSEMISVYRELSDYHLSHRGRFLVERNQKVRHNLKQYNNTSRTAARTLASGMMAGITSPARPWFKLQSPDARLNEVSAVKKWLHDVQKILYAIFAASNTYNSLHQLYSELGVFGTGALGVFGEFDNVIWCKPYTVGSYVLATNGRNFVDTFYREYCITVGDCVKRFGKENCSKEVQKMWNSGSLEVDVTVYHCIEPNDDRDNTSPMAKDKKFRSVYFERGEKEFLLRSGFDHFPILTPRWDVVSEEVYAMDCPGLIALGDAKALQLGEKRKYQAVDKLVSPPLKADSSLRENVSKGGLKPNDIVWTNSNKNIESIYGNYRPDLSAVMAIQQESEDRIRRAFYEDLFLMLANTDRREITAREVAEKHEEKLLMLGPVLERVHTELLNPMIDRAFSISQSAGILPPPPRELVGVEVGVEFVSVLAQAQRLADSGGIDRLTQFAGALAQIWPEARHKIDVSQAVDDYASALGVNPNLVVGNDDARAMAEQEKAQALAAQQGAAMQQGVETAKVASETQMGDGDDLLSRVMQGAGS